MMPETKRDVEAIIQEQIRPLIEQMNKVCTENDIKYLLMVQMFDFPPQEGDGFSVSANLDPETTATILYDLHDVAMGTSVAVELPKPEAGVQ